MGCEITFDFCGFTVNGVENYFEFGSWNRVILQNAKLDISKCHFNFNRADDKYIQFVCCEFYSSSILSNDIFLCICNQCQLIFEACSFHDIKFNINSNSDLISGNCIVAIIGCSFDRIYDFNSIINLGVCCIDTTFNNLEGNLIFGNSVLEMHHIKVENSILNNISSNGDDIGDRDSKFDYTKPKDKDLTASILSNLI